MSVSEPFIRRPIATSLLGIALLIGGALGYWTLPISALPQVDFPTVQVTTQLPGASADVIASLITAPLERQLGQIPSLSSMTSTSSFGVSQISLQFDLNRDIDGATQDVQAAINAAAGVLPKTLPYPPTYAKVNPADAPVLTLALTSDTVSLRAMSDLADTILGQRLSQIAGVGRVSVLGGLKPAVRVQADLARLAAYGIAMEDLRNAIAGANVSGPKGSLDGAQQAYTIAANDQIAAADAYRPIIIAYRNGSPVTIGDVAQIVDGLENDRTGGWYQGTPAVIIDIQRQPGANVIEVVRLIQAEIPKLQRSIPAGVKLTVVSDRTVTIRASVHDVQFTLVLSVVLVTLVVLLFLRSLRATLIAGVALPLSLITSFGIMYFSGFSLDNLSLMALTIGTGFVVDDAIVMIENIVRHMENGESAMEASLRGASEIGFTVISLTVSLIAVFIPLLFMSGLVGRMFREFALTLTIAVVTSAIVSLTLTPMMCSRLLKHAGEEIAVPGLAWVSHFIDRTVEFYHRTLLWVLERQRATMLVTLATIVATLVLYVVAPKGFLPLQDTASITAVTQAGPDVSFAEMQSRQTKAADAIKADPDVTGVVSVIGAGSVNPTTNVGRLVMTLKPRGERRDDVSIVVARLKERVKSIPGMTIYFQPVQDVQISTQSSRSQYQYTLTGTDAALVTLWANNLVAELRRDPLFRDVSSEAQDGGLRAALDINRQRAGQLGVSIQGVNDTLNDAFAQRQISTIYGQANQYRVVLEALPVYQRDPSILSKLYLPGALGAQVPLSAVATLTRTTAPLAISHQAQFPAVSLSFNLAPGAALGDAVDAVKSIETRIGMPGSIVGIYAGDAAEFSKSLAGQPWLILAALVTIYIVLGVLYESYIHPITILSTLPSAGVGAILALMLFGQDLSVIGLIGIILLMGIVKKNAIMMIDFALEAERHQGMSAMDAIVQACLLRFRPIMMTTLAALFGALPLAVESGTGAELRFPLGISIIGGLLLSQLLTLYTTPVIYLALDRVNRRIENAVPPAGPELPPVAGATEGDAVMASISEPFIRRPVGTTLLAIGLFLVGGVAYEFLPVAAVPNVDFPSIWVSATRPGADPSVMAATVAAPLERRLGQIAGIDQITSWSLLGRTSIQLQFAIGRDIDRAARDVQAAINASLADLPSDLPTLPRVRKANTAGAPVFVLALTSKTIPSSAIYDVADTVIAQRISQVPGVGEVTVSGADQPAVRIALNPVALSNAGIATDDVRLAVINANPLGPVGIFNGGRQSETLSVNRQMRTAAEFRDIMIKSSNGNFVRLSDVAEVEGSVRNTRSIAWFNKQPAVLIQITKQGDANVIDTVDRVRALLPELKRWIPGGVEISTLVDRTGTIRASVQDMQLTLLATCLLVMVVVFAFLRRLTPTVAAGVSVPLALAGTCAGMWAAGFSIDNLSLMALAISVGFVVDDAIVMIENMYRNLEHGMRPYQAALEGAKQIGFTVLSISLSLIAAFTPLIFMDGIVGRLLREFSLTLTFAIVVSTVVSLTITPMICAHYIKAATSDNATWLDRVVEGSLSRIVSFYARTLRVVLGFPFLTLMVFFATIALTVTFYIKTPKGYFPTDDSGFVIGSTRASADISFQAMLGLQQQLADIVMADPAVAGIGSVLGGGGGPGGAGSNRGMMFISLKPVAERAGVTTALVIDRLRKNLGMVPGIRLFMFAAQDVRAGGRQSDSDYQYTLSSTDLDLLQKWARIVGKRMETVEGITDVSSDRDPGGLQLTLAIDRKAASSLGVRVQDIDNALNNAFSQRQISIIYTQRNQYMVVLEIDPKFQRDPSNLEHIFVAGAGGAQVPLSTVVHYQRGLSPLALFHSQSFPSTTVSFNLLPDVPLEVATSNIQRAVEELHMPEGIRGSFDGNAGDFNKTSGRQPLLILGALVAMYIVLGVLYESLAHPLTIISTLPSAGLGALLALQITNTPLTVIAFVGIILLIGIVKKNGIMMVDFALDAERHRGLSSADAIFEACRVRFRPILMTTMAALFAGIPLVIATGPGTELRRPLGITIIGGLLVSQILTLYTTPVIYLLIDRLRRRSEPAAIEAPAE